MKKTLVKNIFYISIGPLGGAALTFLLVYFFILNQMPISPNIGPFQTNIIKATEDNKDFRHVLFTGAKSQLVVMSIPPGGEVGEETHQHVEQTLYFQSGTGEAFLNGKKSPIGPGDVVVVTPGTLHNFINTGKVPLQIFTTYAPPNHIDGRIQHTIADEKADTADEAFGEAVK